MFVFVFVFMLVVQDFTADVGMGGAGTRFLFVVLVREYFGKIQKLPCPKKKGKTK